MAFTCAGSCRLFHGANHTLLGPIALIVNSQTRCWVGTFRPANSIPLGAYQRTLAVVQHPRLSQSNVTKDVICSASNQNPPGSKGLVNLGNSCYQNAVLQCLNSIPDFVGYVRGDLKWNKGARVGPSLAMVFNELWSEESGGVVSAEPVRKAVLEASQGLAIGSQEDAHEFLLALINALREEGSRREHPPVYRELSDQLDVEKMADEHWDYSREWNDSPVDDIFGFQLLSTVQCPECGHASHRFEYTTELQLSLSDLQDCVELCTCIQEFMDPEYVDGYICGSCKNEVRAVKKTSVYRFPQALLIVLNRFTSAWDGFDFRASKVPTRLSLGDDQVDFSPVSSGLTNIEVNPPLFELVAFANHFGNLEFGHYTASARSIVDGGFRAFNDSRITELQGSDIQDAYILVFLRKD